MTTIINTPPHGKDSDSGVAIVIGVFVALILVVLFFIYFLPSIQENTTDNKDSIDVNIKLPTKENAPPAGNSNPDSTY